ncbi:hypothetical protein AWB95_07750 [Mycobacterium celatum]|uniref:Uncharacterized protein n=1 Tax=Mycobacterium celatum TaxID=28045 RepID=A0A1X1RT63_MYCCE|nr:hypothetical protein AWB95_07750 [Mycobacterium celatum]PIB77332.1 hypothetical protein CQY23_17280 [Mycobacterium celatum]
MLVMISGTGIAGLPGQARADTPQCVADQTDPCPPPADGSVDPSTPPRVQQRMANRPRLQIICQPAAKVGAFCYRRIVR